jgi:hypothetical protein
MSYFMEGIRFCTISGFGEVGFILLQYSINFSTNTDTSSQY